MSHALAALDQLHAADLQRLTQHLEDMGAIPGMSVAEAQQLFQVLNMNIHYSGPSLREIGAP